MAHPRGGLAAASHASHRAGRHRRAAHRPFGFFTPQFEPTLWRPLEQLLAAFGRAVAGPA